jgi:hypothetical protein
MECDDTGRPVTMHLPEQWANRTERHQGILNQPITDVEDTVAMLISC